MGKAVYQTEYANHIVTYSFFFPATRYQFHPWPHKAEGQNYDIAVTKELIDLARTLLPEGSSDAYVEYRVLIELTARVLLKWDCCIFHAVSFIWNGYAFLLAAPSGTGKTTQYLNWERLHPGEITMISGDMPVLERRDDGSIWVYPTSWNGKENIGNRVTAPLGGIVFLKQGNDLSISPFTPNKALLPFFEQFIVRPHTEKEILALARLMDQIIQSIPVWEMVNIGDERSTELLRETFMKRLKELPERNDGKI